VSALRSAADEVTVNSVCLKSYVTESVLTVGRRGLVASQVPDEAWRLLRDAEQELFG